MTFIISTYEQFFDTVVVLTNQKQMKKEQDYDVLEKPVPYITICHTFFQISGTHN